ncbi:uncharacterized protein LOC144118575 isoform X3 [Amblyomma americanum]
MTVGKMAFLSLLVAAYLLMITGSAAGKVIFGPDVFGTSDQCNGTDPRKRCGQYLRTGSISQF